MYRGGRYSHEELSSCYSLTSWLLGLQKSLLLGDFTSMLLGLQKSLLLSNLVLFELPLP